jgi:hypothetical protein
MAVGMSPVEPVLGEGTLSFVVEALEVDIATYRRQEDRDQKRRTDEAIHNY